MKSIEDNTFLIKHLDFLKSSFLSIDRRFFLILLFEVLVLLSVFLSYQGWVMAAYTQVSNMDSVLSNVKLAGSVAGSEQILSDNISHLRGQDVAVQMILYKLILFAAVAFLLCLGIVSFLKLKIYCWCFDRAVDRWKFLRFALFSAFWYPFLSVAFIVVQRPFFVFFRPSLSTSMFAQAVFTLVLAVVFIFLFYLTIGLFGSFVCADTWRSSFSLFWKRFVLRLWFGSPVILVCVLIFIFVNLLLFLVKMIPSRRWFFILTLIILLCFFIWSRLYISRVVSHMFSDLGDVRKKEPFFVKRRRLKH
jgi:hypothetical protein